MEEDRSSRTSEWVAALRALYTGAPAGLDIAPDPIAFSLLPTILQQQVRAMQLSPLGLRVAHRTLGTLTRGLSYGIPLRTAAIDAALRGAVAGGTRQLVLLGAGLDARAYRMPELAEVAVYELDHPLTQSSKRERIGSRAPLSKSHAFCAIDFEHERVTDVLARATFDLAAPSFWIWEGVTMYLTPDAIRATLDEIASASAAESRLAMTYSQAVDAPSLSRAFALTVAKLIREPLHGHMSTREAHALLDERGFCIESDEAAADWAVRYWPASEHRRGRAYERLVVARRDR